MSQYLLGYDLGSSSVKVSLVDARTGQTLASAQSPTEEMSMQAIHPGWAEQDPEMWWEHAQKATHACFSRASVSGENVAAIGISYQMHGLVCVDKNQNVLRPSIIWCDSRAVAYGQEALNALGESYCLGQLLNSPGNFTASKLKWVKEHEPEIFERIDKVMLPGDFLAMKLTGEIVTTVSGLSEGVLWDYQKESPSDRLLDYYGIPKRMLADVAPTFGVQGKIKSDSAKLLNLKTGTPVCYRAGDQPNNAFSLNVLNPGETAATAGTSGVIYSVTDKNAFDAKSRVNTFVHVNNKRSHTGGKLRNGVLLCVNGTGIQNSWLRKNTNGQASSQDYEQMNVLAARAPIGSDGLVVLPFGNGAERVLENKNIEGSFHGLNFNRHEKAHLLRAAQEGIVFALRYGFDILQDMGLKTEVIRAGHANMFLSPLFRDAFVNTIGARLELYDTDGAKGAALGAGVGAGIYQSFEEAFQGLKRISLTEPDHSKQKQYADAYQHWLNHLNKQL
jgi:xylulokinase